MTVAGRPKSADHFVRGLYDGVTDAGFFDQLTRKLHHHLELGTVQWTVIDRRIGSITSNSLSEDFGNQFAEYEREFWSIDPRVPETLKNFGRLLPCWKLVDPDTFDRSPVVGDWTDRKDVDRRWCAPVTWAIDERHAALLVYLRPRKLGAHQIDELRPAKALLPHLRRAAELRHLLAGDAGASGLFADQWGSAHRAIFWLGAGRRILARNAAAERLLSLGHVLTATWGRLSARAPHDDAVLEAAIQASSHEPPPPAQIIAPLAGLGAGVAWRARVVSLGGAAAEIGVARGASHLLELEEIGRSAPVDVRPILRLGLRPTEAALALLLSSGIGVEAAATRMGLKPGAALHMIQGVVRRLDVQSVTALLALVRAQIP
jgi:DNA-binding CsgD family transcriptional regulator